MVSKCALAPAQAAVDAGCPYVWAFDPAGSIDGGSEQLTGLVNVMGRCLAPEATDRPTTTALVTALSQMKLGGPGYAVVGAESPLSITTPASLPYDAWSISIAPGITADLAVMPPPLPVTATVVGVGAASTAAPATGASYDVMAIMGAMEEQAMDANVTGLVGDAIGHLSSSSLDVLKAAGVPALKILAIRRVLAASPAPVNHGTITLNVLDLLVAMEAMAFAPSLQEQVAELFVLQDSVTLAELRTAVDAVTLPGRDLLRLRRALDPMVRLSAPPVLAPVASLASASCGVCAFVTYQSSSSRCSSCQQAKAAKLKHLADEQVSFQLCGPVLGL